MAGVAYAGHKLTQTSKSVSYTAQEYDSCKYYDPETGCSGGYNYPTRSGTIRIDGTVRGDSTDVLVNGKQAVYAGGKTTERDSWRQPSNYYSGVTLHSNGAGTISSGNNKNVFINGKLAAIKGSSVSTHESISTTIAEGATNVFIGD